MLGKKNRNRDTHMRFYSKEIGAAFSAVVFVLHFLPVPFGVPGVISVFAPPAPKVRNSFLFQGREERSPIRLYGAIRPKIRRSHWAAREEFLTFWAEWNSGGGVLFLPKKASRRSGGEKKGGEGGVLGKAKRGIIVLTCLKRRWVFPLP